MDSKTIITIICTFIVTGIFAPFSRVIFEKIFAKYDPDIKKINSGIKKALLFIFRYLLPIANLIFVLIFFKTVDKLFVIIVAFVISSLLFNILFDILFSFINKVYLTDNKSIGKIIDRIITVVETQHTGTIDAFKKLADLHKDHLKITETLTDKMKDQSE